MDVEFLARLQFAVTIMFHYIYPPLSIGLGLFLVIVEFIYLRTDKPLYLEISKFWTRVFALIFAIGVATGIVMQFEFGTNWATYSRYVGDVFGSALAAEGIFAFFLESGFLAILLFGWNRVGKVMHFVATLMVCIGAHFSAVWIVVANSWMQTPAGFKVIGEGIDARVQILDFWTMVFNPSSMDRLAHVLIGAWLAGAFLVISVSAYYILKKRHLDFAKSSLRAALAMAAVSLVLQLITGDSSARGVAATQPAKLAAFEGIFETQRGAALAAFGLVNTQEKRVDYMISAPYLLSFLVHRDFMGEIVGLDQFPEQDWPNVAVVFQTYHLMIAMWGAMAVVTVLAYFYLRRRTLYETRWLLWLLVISVLFPQVANQMGWVSAEMGRYPWIVYGLLRISEGLSKAVTANQILGSLIMFTVVYIMLFALFIYSLHEKFTKGPVDTDYATPYHQQHVAIEESTHDRKSD